MDTVVWHHDVSQDELKCVNDLLARTSWRDCAECHSLHTTICLSFDVVEFPRGRVDASSFCEHVTAVLRDFLVIICPFHREFSKGT